MFPMIHGPHGLPAANHVSKNITDPSTQTRIRKRVTAVDMNVRNTNEGTNISEEQVFIEITKDQS